MSEAHSPFTTLGKHLKYIREQSEQSLAEVSGAVEIEEQRLARIEAGEERPAEDILLLLISHFSVAERDALQLWELADYTGEVPEQLKPEIELPAGSKSVVMLLSPDTRTMYSDGAEIAVTPAGVTLNFTQDNAKGQAAPIARVGMSLEQAEQVLRSLQHAVMLAHHRRTPKPLPPYTDQNSDR